MNRHYCRAGPEGQECRLTQSSISNTWTSRTGQTRSNKIKENNYSTFLNLTDDIYINFMQFPVINPRFFVVCVIKYIYSAQIRISSVKFKNEL